MAAKTGNEQVLLQIDGQTVQTWTPPSTNWAKNNYTYTHTSSVAAGQVRVVLASGSGDNQVNVDYITIDGTNYPTTDSSVESSGSWTSATGCGQGFKQTEHIGCGGGWFQFAGSTTTPTTTAPTTTTPTQPTESGDSVTVRMAVKTGNEQVSLQIDSQTVQTWTPPTSNWAKNNYTYTHTSSVAAGQVRVVLASGSGDNQVNVDYITIDGTNYPTTDSSVESSGSWTSATGCGRGFKQTEHIGCGGGWFQFAGGTTTPTPTTTAAPTTTTTTVAPTTTTTAAPSTTVPPAPTTTPGVHFRYGTELDVTVSATAGFRGPQAGLYCSDARTTAGVSNARRNHEIDMVALLYYSVFGRTPDQDGCEYWWETAFKPTTNPFTKADYPECVNPADPDADISRLCGVAYWMMIGVEYENAYSEIADGHAAHAGWLELVYNNILGRPSDAEGFNHWLNLMPQNESNIGVKRQLIFANIAVAEENWNIHTANLSSPYNAPAPVVNPPCCVGTVSAAISSSDSSVVSATVSLGDATTRRLWVDLQHVSSGGQVLSTEDTEKPSLGPNGVTTLSLRGPKDGLYRVVVSERNTNGSKGRRIAASATVDVNKAIISSASPTLQCQGRTYRPLEALKLDFDVIEDRLEERLGGQQTVVPQTVLDVPARWKKPICDRYSHVINNITRSDAETLLRASATQMDWIGGFFADQADWTRHGGPTPRVGDLYDIDITNPLGIADISPWNAPVVISHIEPAKFRVVTVDWNTKEHGLFGVREFGFEQIDSDSFRFYTEGISTEDNSSARIGATQSENLLWTAYLRYLTDAAINFWGATARVGISSEQPRHNETGSQLTQRFSQDSWNQLARLQQKSVRRQMVRMVNSYSPNALLPNKYAAYRDEFIEWGCSSATPTRGAYYYSTVTKSQMILQIQRANCAIPTR